MAVSVDITLKFRYQKTLVLLTAKKSDTVKKLKKQLVEALNETNVLRNSSLEGATLLEDHEIDIPKPSFEVEDIPIPKPSFETGGESSNDEKKEEKTEEKTEETRQLKEEDIKIALPGDSEFTSFKELKDSDVLGTLKDNDVVAFTPSQEDEFEIEIIRDEEGEDYQ
ncbi:conserved hypothetical protein [Geotrichum candidum]|uniref:Ubiquitin-like domain-containing protein n=1 Tax=Geotrichum candidum TaxID=1173061 RepID=A0A0J9XEJ8_GEOCN|nr:conserved hypothetical protein [Geotrichum candidum]